MAQMTVTHIAVPALLQKLREVEWCVPQFQREFVWSIEDVKEFLISILESRPIGMATLWEQPDVPQVDLELVDDVADLAVGAEGLPLRPAVSRPRSSGALAGAIRRPAGRTRARSSSGCRTRCRAYRRRRCPVRLDRMVSACPWSHPNIRDWW